MASGRGWALLGPEKTKLYANTAKSRMLAGIASIRSFIDNAYVMFDPWGLCALHARPGLVGNRICI